MSPPARIRLAHLSEANALSDALAGVEEVRMAEIKNDAVRCRFVLSRVLRRKLLAECLACPPSALRFGENREGKPHLLPPTEWDFNVSHAGDFVVVVAARHPVGVDLEAIREVREMSAIVARYFHRDEAVAWFGVGKKFRQEAFYLLWSAREAAMKCAGLGLAKGLAITRVDPAILSAPVAMAAVGSRTMSVRRLNAPPGYVMFLAEG
jgi:4'-phosphopantetheinyl transferase